MHCAFSQLCFIKPTCSDLIQNNEIRIKYKVRNENLSCLHNILYTFLHKFNNTRSKTRLNSSARPFTPLHQCDAPRQVCATTADSTKSCLYHYSGMLGWEKALFDKMMSVHSPTKQYAPNEFGYG